MKKMLFCTDLSKNCLQLCKYVASWVKETDISVDIIHSYDPNFSNITSIDNPISTQEMEEKMMAIIKQNLKDLPLPNRGKIHLEADHKWINSIRQVAKNIKADLIVTGIQEQYTLMDKFFGSTVTKLIDDSDPPLLAIPYGRPFRPIQNILFTTDSQSKKELTIKEEEALTWIYDHLSKDTLLDIHILHITKGKESVTKEDHKLMQMEFTSSYSPDVVMGIIDHLEKSSTDIIAVHHNKRNLIERIHHSSVAKNLLYKAKMPVLFI